jgi:hypothetical protein
MTVLGVVVEPDLPNIEQLADVLDIVSSKQRYIIHIHTIEDGHRVTHRLHGDLTHADIEHQLADDNDLILEQEMREVWDRDYIRRNAPVLPVRGAEEEIAPAASDNDE